MADSKFLREKAAKCRRMAAEIMGDDDHSPLAVIALAEEFEAQPDHDDSLLHAVENETAREIPIAAMKPPEEQPDC